MAYTASNFALGSTSNENILVRVTWDCEGDIALNESSVVVKLQYKNNTGYPVRGIGAFSMTVNGYEEYTEGTFDIAVGDWVTVLTFSQVLYHENDGSLGLGIDAEGSISDSLLTDSSVETYVDLYTFPRTSTINSVSCSTFYLTGTITYKFTTINPKIYHKCEIGIMRTLDEPYTVIRSIFLGKKAVGQHTETVEFTEDELSIIYNKRPNSSSANVVFTLYSYSDSEYITQIDSDYEFKQLYIPNASGTQPTATMTLKPVNSLASPFNDWYIRGKTKVDVDFTDGEGKYGATIASYSMKVLQLGESFPEPHISGYLTTPGTVDVYGYVTDSRGFTREYHQQINVIEYFEPKILPISGESNIICDRCDEDGNFNEDGTYIKIKARRGYSKVVVSGAQNNFCSIRYRYKAHDTEWSEWATILEENATNDEVATGALLGNLEPDKSYTVQVGVIDTLGETGNTTINISTGKPYMHRAGSLRSLGIGKYAEEKNTIDIAEDMTTHFRGAVKFNEQWVSCNLGSNITASDTSVGRSGKSGMHYMVCAGGKHIYVAFNVSFVTSSSIVQVGSQPIPNAPNCNVYALCPVGFSDGSRGFATVSVSSEGNVNICEVYYLPYVDISTGDTVAWIDGYIDYWTE